ncbi:MAG: hypothetical protein JWN70_2778 [Planctomycetaceae bacterium]|nr:hypothetical protein [Planctomycetaceae bacterium]
MLVIEPTSFRPGSPESWFSRHLGWVFVIVASLCLLTVFLWWYELRPQFGVQPLRDQRAVEGYTVTVDLDQQWKQWSAAPLEYTIVSGPTAARIDRRTNSWQWTPGETAGGQKFRVKLHCRMPGKPFQQADCEFTVDVREGIQNPIIAPIPDQTVEKERTLTLTVQAQDPDDPQHPLRYKLGRQAPEGAAIDPVTGKFTWTPDFLQDASAARSYEVLVLVTKFVNRSPARSSVKFKINVPKSVAHTLSKDHLLAALTISGLNPKAEGADDAATGFASPEPNYVVQGDKVVITEYASREAARTAAAAITPAKLASIAGFTKPPQISYLFSDGKLVVIHSGRSEVVHAHLTRLLGEPWISSNSPPPPPPPPAPEIVVEKNKRQFQLCLELAKIARAGKLCDPGEYPNVRRLFADRFAQDHAAELKTAFQGSGAEFERWLGTHPDLRDELYTAFEPEDDIVAALKIMELLQRRSFQRLTANFELAIALAVTWDREAGLYEYTPQQRRSHATVTPEKMADAVDNFDYYTDPEFVGQRRISKLPWEFLLHVVNHRTPLAERAWVQRTYHSLQRPIGLCYEDVPYDHGMIKSGEATSNLAPHAYTLANLKDRGGICVMQADYAARVAKCLGIPGVYVEGYARNNSRHAWVMWTELQPSSAKNVTFSLQSHGRFFLDRYYIGMLRDPQTALVISDRQLELRLQGVGLNPVAYRQTRLIMSVWTILGGCLRLDASHELDYLEALIDFSPGNPAIWQTVTQRTISAWSDAKMKARFDDLRDRCIKTFTNCPDFVCQIIETLMSYEEEPRRRLPTYERLLQLWASTGRPDLSCEIARKIASLLTGEKDYQAALGGLAQTIKRFPDEGRHIPRLLDEYERVAQQVDDGPAKILKLYQELMPLIPRSRQGQTSPFYLEMLQRASQRLARAGETKAAQAYADQLKKLKGK